jgi:hypothetical protein
MPLLNLFELTPAEGAFLRMRQKQPRLSMTRDEEIYWAAVAEACARERTRASRTPLPRPIPPPSLEEDFVNYAATLQAH